MFNRALPTTVLAMILAGCFDTVGPTGVRPSSAPTAIQMVRGDAQTGTVARVLADPLVARVIDARGRPVRNAHVTFEIVAGGGAIHGRASSLTDSGGLASATWRLGVVAGVVQSARARVGLAARSTASLEVAFQATGIPDRASSLAFLTPSSDPIEPAASFTHTVVARAYDMFRNPVPDAVVKWSAPIAGTFDVDQTVTGPDGSTENRWTVRAISRPLLGVGAYWITVSLDGGGLPVGPIPLFTQTVGESRLAASSMAAGGAHACAVVGTGEIYCWGDNRAGQLGDGTSTSRPLAMGVIGQESYTQVVAGASHSCGLATSGKAYCWGNNGDGQLGDGTRVTSSEPVAVVGGETFVSLAAGSWHTCGLTGSGASYCWGANWNGQLGQGSTAQQAGPTLVAGGERFASLTAGGAHTCGLTSGGRLSCWGSNEAGQLGATPRVEGCSAHCAPTPVPIDGTFARSSAGVSYTCGLDTDGATWCWGGYLAARTRVMGDVRFTDLVGGWVDSPCGIGADGRAYCWMFLYDVYYYHDDQPALSEPEPVGGTRLFSALHRGDLHTCGVERGTASWVVCWSARAGVLASGSVDRTEPGFVLRAGQP